jgi:hypothetical protein
MALFFKMLHLGVVEGGLRGWGGGSRWQHSADMLHQCCCQRGLQQYQSTMSLAPWFVCGKLHVYSLVCCVYHAGVKLFFFLTLWCCLVVMPVNFTVGHVGTVPVHTQPHEV